MGVILSQARGFEVVNSAAVSGYASDLFISARKGIADLVAMPHYSVMCTNVNVYRTAKSDWFRDACDLGGAGRWKRASAK
jgi:hypothetical protein